MPPLSRCAPRAKATSVPPAREARGGPHGEAEDLAAVGLEQHVLHAEGRGAEGRGHEEPQRPAAAGEDPPGLAEGAGVLRLAQVAAGVPGLLLPQGRGVEHHRHHGGALDDLDQLDLGEVGEQGAEGQRAHHHARQQHHVQQRHDARPRVLRGQVGGERKPGRLRGVQPRADEQEGERRRHLAEPQRPGGVAGQDEQRERHDREAAPLQQRAAPDERHPPPAQRRAVGIGAEADERAEWGEQQRQPDHQADEPGRHAQLDDHHAVEGAGEEHRGHADGHLEEREAQQPGQRQLGRGGVGEGQVLRTHGGPFLHPAGQQALGRPARGFAGHAFAAHGVDTAAAGCASRRAARSLRKNCVALRA